MTEKCMANCMAKPIHLHLRNKIFYYRVELPRVNNKRRYKIISLHTQNYYEAQEKIRQMEELQEKFARLQKLYFNLIYIRVSIPSGIPSGNNFGVISTGISEKKLSDENKVEDVKELYTLILSLSKQVEALTEGQQALIEKVSDIVPNIKEFLGPTIVSLIQSQFSCKLPNETDTTTYTIGKVLDFLLLRKQATNTENYQNRKKQAIVKALEEAGLSLNDDYIKFHNVNTVEKITKSIIIDKTIKNDNKKMKVRYLKELAACGNNLNPDLYSTNIINVFPQIENTKKADKSPHQPYTKEQLLEIFNPKYDFFKNNPDAFWTCMIALFTGARMNAAITLQYKDIFTKDGIACIQFLSDHSIKQLKNEASERLVPIHKQLLELGFVDYIKRKQTKLKAKDTDFIITKCQTKSGQYNNKYFTRELSPFFTDIRVKTEANDGYDFHSFRKNISIAMQDAGIINTYINDVIGWEGKSTMEQSYSNHRLEEIKAQLNKFEYDFLKPHFAKWKTIMAKK
ncbi:MAG: site-specific integrase [Alphaproteobacteria bacterium]|nr:site-specific integrase [Alphaproteobacteria bacterium]